MKKVLILISVLLLLAACAPQAPVQPVVSQADAAAQFGVQPPRPVAVQPPPVVAPVVQATPQEVKVAEPVPQSGKTVNSVIDKFAFAPEIRIKAGDTIVWTNKDSAPHDVTSTSPEQRFQSSVLKTGESFSRQFNEPGTYSYKCSLHPVMRGTVVVE